MIVVVTGSREWTDRMRLRDELETIHRRYTIDLLIEGDADGVDKFAGSWAAERGIPLAKMPYAVAYGKGGGPVRNGWMLALANSVARDRADSVLVVAFPTKSSVGTWNCVQQAKGLGIHIRIVHDKGMVMRPVGAGA